MKHILYISQWFPTDSKPDLGTFVYKHAQAAALKHKVTVIYVYPHSENERQATTEGNLNIIRLGIKGSGWKLSIKKRNCYQKEIAQLQAQEPIDIIHAHVLLAPAIIAFRWAKKLNIPFFITEHWTGYCNGLYQKKSALYRRLSKKVCASAKAIFPVSPFLAEHMQACGLQGNYQIIPNVLDEHCSEPKKLNQGPHLTVVADLVDAKKNVSGSIRAFEKVWTDNPELHLVIVGDGPDRKLLESLCQELGIQQQVKFMGKLNHESTLQWIAGGQLTLVNSNIETFSVVTAESIMHGVPVIGTACGGPEFIIEDGKTGFIIPPKHKQQLQQAIQQALEPHMFWDPSYMKNQMNKRFGMLEVAELLHSFYTD